MSKTDDKTGEVSRSLDGLVGNLLWFIAGFVLFAYAIGTAKDRGFVEGCEFTRHAMVEAIREWKKSE